MTIHPAGPLPAPARVVSTGGAAYRAPAAAPWGAYAPTYAPTYAADQWRPAATTGHFQALARDGGFLGWLGGALVAGFWAVPKLARFGPVGFLTSALVVLAGGFYGKRVVAAVQDLLAGSARGAAEVAAWFAGARLAAGVVGGMSKPGAFVAALLIWLGSWAADKLLDALWPAGRSW